jgi:PAS domain S-box-containing protein
MDKVAPEWLRQVATVLETLNQGVIINDDERRIVFANAIFLELTGLSAGEILGREVQGLFPSQDVPLLLEQIERRRARGKNQFEFYLPQSNGGRLPVVVTARQIQAPDGRPYAVVTVTDISEQKRVQTELSVANSQLEARQREIEAELLLAASVQQSLAPKSLSWGRVGIETFYQPARTIGGDFGLVTPGADYLNLLVCDISGHGIGSALVANRIYTETKSQIEQGVGLGAMLHHLNRFAIQNLSSSSFYFTLAATRLDRAGSRLQFAGAGHPPAMIVRPGGSPRLLASLSGVLGLFDDAVDGKAVIQVPVQIGDRIVIYTDGLTENFNSQEEMLGINGLAEIVRDTATLPLPAMKQEILNRVASWRTGPAADDVSLVIAEVS